MFRPLSEAFIRRSWYSGLPALDTTGRRRVKRAVVCVSQLVVAVITVHGLLSFLSDVYGHNVVIDKNLTNGIIFQFLYKADHDVFAIAKFFLL